jgi:hypothetical protein
MRWTLKDQGNRRGHIAADDPIEQLIKVVVTAGFIRLGFERSASASSHDQPEVIKAVLAPWSVTGRSRTGPAS